MKLFSRSALSPAPAPRPQITVALTPHPVLAEVADLPLAGGDRVLVRMWREPDAGAVFEFSIERAAPGQLRLPSPRPPAAADGLWQHSCCEVFLALPGCSAYHEYNFSPSGQWAVYAFSSERVRCEFNPEGAPVHSVERQAGGFSLRASIPAALLPAGSAAQALEVGLACVLERSDQTLEHWAARHGAEVPDFHRRDSFCLLLPPADHHP